MVPFYFGDAFLVWKHQKKWWWSNLQKNNFMIDKHPKHPTAWHPCYLNPTSATLPIAVPTLCRSAVARMRQLPRRTVGASSSLAAAAPGLVGLVGWWGASLRKLRFLGGETGLGEKNVKEALPSLKLHSPYKWMVGILLSYWVPAYFQGRASC